MHGSCTDSQVLTINMKAANNLDEMDIDERSDYRIPIPVLWGMDEKLFVLLANHGFFCESCYKIDKYDTIQYFNRVLQSMRV